MTRQFGGVPRESQTLRLPATRLESFRDWGVDGTARTAAPRVRDPAGRIALVQNEWSRGWILPGGAVESGEKPAAAARREVHEETGLCATIGDPVVVVDQTFAAVDGSAPSFSAEYIVFEATAEGEIPDVDLLGVDDEEISAAAWFETLPEALHDGELLREYL